jgi:hypothetical protein
VTDDVSVLLGLVLLRVGSCWDVMFFHSVRLYLLWNFSSDESDDDQYEVESILACQRVTSRGKTATFYRIRWKNFGPTSDSWEPEQNLNCPELLNTFRKRHQQVRDVGAIAKRQKLPAGARLVYHAHMRTTLMKMCSVMV